MVTIYFTYKFSYSLAYGYVPIHFLLFLISGFLLYYLIRNNYIEGLLIIYDLFKKIKKVLIKIIVFLCYPKEVIGIFLLMLRIIKKTIFNFFKALKKKNKKMNY
jgi:hypothetical protein